MSQLEAASLSQLQAGLLDVASLGQLEAASLSLEEALSFNLLNREGAPSLIPWLEGASCISLLRRKGVLSQWARERKRAAQRQKEAQPADRHAKSITLHEDRAAPRVQLCRPADHLSKITSEA